ncbi:4542_t:CDS:2, partial [Funneliformis geosporum]
MPQCSKCQTNNAVSEGELCISCLFVNRVSLLRPLTINSSAVTEMSSCVNCRSLELPSIFRELELIPIDIAELSKEQNDELHRGIDIFKEENAEKIRKIEEKKFEENIFLSNPLRKRISELNYQLNQELSNSQTLQTKIQQLTQE